MLWTQDGANAADAVGAAGAAGAADVKPPSANNWHDVWLLYVAQERY